MHVGLYSPSWPPVDAPNGIVTYVSEMKAGLEANGHSVTVITRHGAWPGMETPAPVRSTGLRALLDRWRPEDVGCFPRSGRRLAAHIAALHRRRRFDAVEMEETFGWSRFVQVAIDVPVVVRLHGPHFVGKDDNEDAATAARSGRREAAEGAAIGAARGLTSPSARLLDATLDHYRLARTDGRAIPNPIRPVPNQEAWQLDESDPDLVLWVGRFDRRKGADIVLQAFALAARDRPNLRLQAVGPDHGLQLAPGEFIDFEEYRRTHLPPEIAARIDYLGMQPPARIAALRRRARACLSGSRFETFSYVIAEAMVLGCPAIGTDIYGVGEIIVPGASGWLAPSEDWIALAHAIGEAIDNPAECARRGANARERSRALFDPVRVAADTAAYYTSLG